MNVNFFYAVSRRGQVDECYAALGVSMVLKNLRTVIRITPTFSRVSPPPTMLAVSPSRKNLFTEAVFWWMRFLLAVLRAQQ